MGKPSWRPGLLRQWLMVLVQGRTDEMSGQGLVHAVVPTERLQIQIHPSLYYTGP